jgi:hypothetical protein
MTLLDPYSARTAILHALTQRPFMTTREVADACPKFAFAYASVMVTEYCEVCNGPHYEPCKPMVEYYTLRNDAYNLLKFLERRGKVQQIKVEGIQKSVWCLVPVREQASRG